MVFVVGCLGCWCQLCGAVKLCCGGCLAELGDYSAGSRTGVVLFRGSGGGFPEPRWSPVLTYAGLRGVSVSFLCFGLLR